MSVDTVINKLGLRGVHSVNQAIVTVSEFLSDKPEGEVNNLIAELGARPVESHPVDADIMLKAIVERVISGQFVDIAEAQDYGRQKIDQLRRKLPFVFVEPQAPAPVEPVPGQRTKGHRNSKNSDSMTMVTEMTKAGCTDRGEITKAVAEKLGIDYANAFFYVKKAEKQLGVTLTAKKGRKPVKKAV